MVFSELMVFSEVVVTGIGIVCPLGFELRTIWEAVLRGRCGIRPISAFEAAGLPTDVAGEIVDFDPVGLVRPRKAAKLMCRDSQLAVAASLLAFEAAGFSSTGADPDRIGVVLGADRIGGSLAASEGPYRVCYEGGRFQQALWGTKGLAESPPLEFLKTLPNMVSAHVSIACDARGPNNTIHHGDISGHLAIAEAVRILRQGRADVVLAGGTSARIRPYDWVGLCRTADLASSKGKLPEEICRPFDRLRSGQVIGEGACVLVLERREDAERRGATIQGRLLATAAAFAPPEDWPPRLPSLERVIQLTLQRTGRDNRDIAFGIAHGLSTVRDDIREAQTWHRLMPALPLCGLKSFFGNLGAAGGALEAALAIKSLAEGWLPATLNYELPDPDCPVAVSRSARPVDGPAAVVAGFTKAGQATAILMARA
jgi:3-oxoacyl-[acyl-carrier-protein] synthase II